MTLRSAPVAVTVVLASAASIAIAQTATPASGDGSAAPGPPRAGWPGSSSEHRAPATDPSAPHDDIWLRTVRAAAVEPGPPPPSETRDAEAPAVAPPPTAPTGKAVRIPMDERDPVALACGDLDGDGVLEAVVVGRRRITLGRWQTGQWRTIGSKMWSSLAPVAPVPLREPLAGAAIVDATCGRFVDVGITDRARGVRLGPDLAVVADIAGVPLASPPHARLCGASDRGGAGVVPGRCVDPAAPRSPLPCSDPRPAALPSGAVDGFARARLTLADGSTVMATAWHDPVSRMLVAQIGERPATTLPGGGPAVAIGDRDENGVPDVAYALDVLEPSTDAVVVGTMTAATGFQEASRTAVPAGVRGLAMCPADAAGPAAIVAAAPGELWVFR